MSKILQKYDEVPKDLGLVVKTKEEAFWTEARDDNKERLEVLEKQVKLLKAVVELAEKNIKDEQSKD